MSARRQEYLESMFADWNGHTLMNIDRIGLGLTLEQAKASDAMSGEGNSWI